jgi:hypothetical protein
MKNYSLELLISKTLRPGITAAAILGVTGGEWYLGSFGSSHVAFGAFRGTSAKFLSPWAVVRDIAGTQSGGNDERALAIA